MKDKFTRINEVELKVYRYLGICYFQKMVFMLEKFIHRKDNGKNQNYHFASNCMEPVEQFVKYLFFNGSIHFRNMCFFVIYCAIKKRFFSFHFYDVLLLVLWVKDLYCVMLQRYNYLRMTKFSIRMKKRRNIRIEKKTEELLPAFKRDYDSSYVGKDLEFIKNLKWAIDNKSELVLDVEDEMTLKRLIALMCQE